MGTGAPLSAEYFDQWYANKAASPSADELMQRHLGLPARLLSTSLLSWDAIAEVTAALRLAPGRVLLDLACGRGGYGLEVAARTRARLRGVDFSGEAVRQAREQARRHGREADFIVGDLADTTLPDASVHAVMCVDAIQFAEPPRAACREMRRVLAPGGRVVVTCWEPARPDDERLPARLRGIDLAADLAAAGFADVVVEARPDWTAREHALWAEAAALDPGADPALAALHDEALRVLEIADRTRRVMASATAG